MFLNFSFLRKNFRSVKTDWTIKFDHIACFQLPNHSNKMCRFTASYSSMTNFIYNRCIIQFFHKAVLSGVPCKMMKLQKL